MSDRFSLKALRLRSRIAPSLAVVFAAFWGSAALADELLHIGTFEWPSEAVVGLSGLEVHADGAGFVAVSDRGWYLSGRFEREGERINGVGLEEFLPILGNDGRPVAARRVGDWSDSEGLAIAPDGTIWISFERWARVARYASPLSGGQWIPDHPSFFEQRENRQLEALALHPNGTLYTFPERPVPDGFPIYALEPDGWAIRGHIAEQDVFSIVGADFDEAGRLYILERKLVLGLWWQNRIRRLHVDAPQDAEILWTGRRGEYYNLEGIAIWRDEIGTRITLVSDNNADQSEPTQFVEYRLVD